MECHFRDLYKGFGPRFINGFPIAIRIRWIFFHSNLNYNTVIATKLCTWYDSCAGVACAKFCCDLMAIHGITVRLTFHRLGIEGKISLWNGLLVHVHGQLNRKFVCKYSRFFINLSCFLGIWKYDLWLICFPFNNTTRGSIIHYCKLFQCHTYSFTRQSSLSGFMFWKQAYE